MKVIENVFKGRIEIEER